MCTLAVWWRTCAEAPILAATNRDELYARPADPPRVDRSGPLALLAPRDPVAGGTWIGVNEARVLVAITNRFGVPRDDRRRSRGLLVTDALAHGSASAAEGWLRSLRGEDTNGFHLLVADADVALLAVGDGRTVDVRRLEPGLHIVTERSFGAAPTAREPLLRRLLADVEPCTARLDEALGPLLSVHAASPLEGTCVHADALGYGTRSSSLVRLGTDGSVEWLFAGGPPCTTPYAAVDADMSASSSL